MEKNCQLKISGAYKIEKDTYKIFELVKRNQGASKKLVKNKLERLCFDLFLNSVSYKIVNLFLCYSIILLHILKCIKSFFHRQKATNQ